MTTILKLKNILATQEGRTLPVGTEVAVTDEFATGLRNAWIRVVRSLEWASKKEIRAHDHDPQAQEHPVHSGRPNVACRHGGRRHRSEEHTSELQSLRHLVCRLLLAK